MGFKNWAEYALSMNCAKNPDNVQSFLSKLKEKLEESRKREMNTLLEYKRKEVILFEFKCIDFKSLILFSS